MSETSFLFEPNSAKLDQKFVVQGKALVLEAFNLPAGTKITFEKLLYKGSGPSMIRTGCCFEIAGKSVAVAARPYKLCDCTPELSNTSPMLVIDQEGIYNAIVTPASSAGLFYVQANEHVFAQVTDAMRGCCPVVGTAGSGGPITCAAIKAAFTTAATVAHSATTLAFGVNDTGDCVKISPKKTAVSVGGVIASKATLADGTEVDLLPAYPVGGTGGTFTETSLVATDSDSIDFTQTGTAGHGLTAVAKISPVAGNLLASTPQGLVSKITCPPTATVATKLCKTDEFVGFNPSTCLPEKFTVGRSNHSYAECSPAVDRLITGPELDTAFAPPPAGVVTYLQAFDVVDTNNAGIGQTVFNPFPVASPSVALAANEAIVLSLTTAKENAIGDSAGIAVVGAGTLTPISNQLFWRSSGNFQTEVRHKVFVFTPTSAGNFTFTATGTYSTPDTFSGAVRLSGVKVTSPNTSAPSLAGSLAWIGNAGDPADPGILPASYGLGLGAQTLTVPNVPAGSPSLWVQTGRHLQTNSAEWSGGGTQILDVGGLNTSSCALSQSNAISTSPSITLLTHVNIGGVADDRLNIPNTPITKDVATGLVFVPSVAGNGGGSGSSTYTIANVCNASVVNINDCPSAYTTVDVSLGTVSGLLDAGQGYDVSIVTGTGRVLGPVSLVNFGTTPRSISVPLPSGHWTNNSALASGATDAVTISYKISGNTHVSGKTGAVLKITPPLTTIEVKHV